MWLIQEDVLRSLAAVQSLGVTLSAAQIEKFEAMAEESPEAAGSRISATNGATAEITVEGVLTERPSMLAMMLGMGGTSYRAIRGALAQADADSGVSDLVMHVKSPGGHIDGLFETLAAIQAFKKPIRVLASNAQSAAYALAAAAGPIEATGPAATFGSVGIVSGTEINDKHVQITNTDSPNKRPDVTTADGKKAVREHLDALHQLFVGAIAEGRTHAGNPVGADDVKKTFGRGATVLADKALSLKMIDAVPQRTTRAVTARRPYMAAIETTIAATDGGNSRKPMNKEEIRAQFPAVYESIVAEATAAAKAEGQASERKRVLAHLKLAKSTGAVKVAHDAIASGASTMDEDVHAEYLSAAINARDTNARQGDAASAAEALDGAATTEASDKKDFGDEVAAEFLKSHTTRKAG